MEFVKEFATFLHRNGIIRFGDFTLASGKKSPYYVDLRLVPGHPHEFRRMVKHLQGEISRDIGLDGFDSVVSVPTGGLVIASALAVEILKPLAYVRSRPKDYGASRLIEGRIHDGMRALLIDDVATTGGSVAGAIRSLQEEGVLVSDAYVIVDRMEGAREALSEMGVRMRPVLDIAQITQALHEQDLVDGSVLERVKGQINS